MTPRRSLVCLVALVVAASIAATAHGLYAVALASGVPWQVACLYPLITDGLALVAYWATKQLASARYPWLVVVVAAGLSGLAQAVNLAGLGESPTWLRFGVGYWPAAAALLSAHLYYLVLVGRPRGLVPARVSEEVRNADGSGVPVPVSPGPSAPGSDSDKTTVTALTVRDSNGDGMSLRAQAEREALEYLKDNGEWPSENTLARLVSCSRSTARKAMEPLKKGEVR